jgi:CO/xanthine dehydrogenase Mo-binding subunit
VDVHLRDLRYFVVVAEERHVTRAAERLYVSQPALSKQGRALERQLGFDLLRPLPRGVDLTAEGEALLPWARDLLAVWDRDCRAARAAGARRTVVVGMQTAVGRDLQRDALAQLRASGWKASLRLVGWSDPTAGLADASSDVAFLWLPLTDPGLVTRVLVREPRWVALPAGHRLAARDEIAFADLLDEPFIALSSPPTSSTPRGWARWRLRPVGPRGVRGDRSIHTYGAVFVEVRVDAELGLVRMNRCVGVYGAGRIINPLAARSQMIGGITWGLGQALLERSTFEPRLGRFLSKNLAGYILPSNADVGDIDVSFVDDHDPRASPLGAKGIGELGAVGVAAALANAVFHATAVRVHELPITIEHLL